MKVITKALSVVLFMTCATCVLPMIFLGVRDGFAITLAFWAAIIAFDLKYGDDAAGHWK